MKSAAFPASAWLILFCLLTDAPAAVCRNLRQHERFTLPTAKAPNFEPTFSTYGKKWDQAKVCNYDPIFLSRYSNRFDAINWFDLIKKTFGRRMSGHIHGKITKTAFKELKIKNEVIRKVIEANWHTDWDEYQKVLPPIPNDKYNPAHHFDRTLGASHSTAFKRGAKYVMEQRNIVLMGLKGEKGWSLNEALTAMGRALHALQDFFSHSNVIDLSPEDWSAAIKALETAADPPASLKITGYDRVGNLVGDQYAHDAFAKENADKNAESKSRMKAGAQAFDPNKTKFERAREAAASCSKHWLINIRDEVGKPAWKRIEKP